jgi:hypothetical protein
MNYPTADEVRAARALAGLTQQQAIELIHQAGNRTWRAYEAGTMRMHPSSWELFLLKTNQHPTLRLTVKG